MSVNGYYHGGIIRTIFPERFELLPNTNQLWEIDMAYGEVQSLGSKERLIERSAFFARIDGHETNHYKVCKASPLQVDRESSIRRQTFFDVNQYKTGYATHGLFPYRGKFHPQLVKAVLNVLKLEKGDTVLDPMAGSGTLCIEAAVNGINSIGIDVSPFCSLMTRAKTEALDVDVERLEASFSDKLRQVAALHDLRGQGTLFQEASKKRPPDSRCEIDPYRDILLLCHLDAMGYAARTANKAGRDLFAVIAERYLAAIKQFHAVRRSLGLKLGEVDVRTGDCRRLEIPDNSVDGIVTSPPYSFAIDYAENDRPQLQYLGYEPDLLKGEMIGLIGGKSVQARVRSYFQDMRGVFAEMSRVLKKGKCCVVVIGSNEIQTGGIRHEVEFAKFGEEVGFKLFWKMVRPIEGIRNSMRDEYVMFFQKL